eukprot:scaffold576_cov260-Pinguiococcus_pyrenoidosus.AAC.23
MGKDGTGFGSKRTANRMRLATTRSNYAALHRAALHCAALHFTALRCTQTGRDLRCNRGSSATSPFAQCSQAPLSFGTFRSVLTGAAGPPRRVGDPPAPPTDIRRETSRSAAYMTPWAAAWLAPPHAASASPCRAWPAASAGAAAPVPGSTVRAVASGTLAPPPPLRAANSDSPWRTVG